MQLAQKSFVGQTAQLQAARQSRATVRAPVVVRAQKQEVGCEMRAAAVEFAIAG